MSDYSISLLSMALTTALLAGALLIGWRRSLRERYVAVLAASFAGISASYALAFLQLVVSSFATPILLVEAATIVGSLVALASGFRLRSGLPALSAGMMVSATAAVVASWSLLASQGGINLLMVVHSAFAVVTLIASAGALKAGSAVGLTGGRPAFWMFAGYAIYLTIQIAVSSLGGLLVPQLLPLAFFMMLLGPSAGMTGVGLFAILIVAEDIAAKLRRAAAVDPLTGILNRRGVDEAGAALVARARRGEAALTVVVADLDRFKSINDRFGHALGDHVLQRFANHLGCAAGAGDLVGRLGGEEFVLVLRATASEAQAAVERTRVSLGAAFDDLALPIAITASYGVAAFEAGDTLATCTIRADRALYDAKMAGRDRVAIAFDDPPRVERHLRLAWVQADDARATESAVAR